MPWRSSIGLAPSSIVRMPSRTIPWASSVAVVVPSPVRSLVLVATSRTSCAPMFLNGSVSSISRAMLTPSLVIVGAPVRRSSTTLRPFGPERHLDGVGELVDARLQPPARVVVEVEDLAHASCLLAGRDEDAAALQPPVVEVVHRVVDRVERIGASCAA